MRAALPEGASDDLSSLRALLTEARIVVLPSSPWSALDRPLLALWTVTAAGALSRLLLALWRLQRVRRRWRPSMIAGERVLISDDLGPAAVGLAGGHVVLPAWALGLDEQ